MMKRQLLFLLLFGAALGMAEDFEASRGSRVSWARLKFNVTGYNPNGNTSLGWFYHPTGDVRVVDFLREHTDINILQEWNIIDVKNLDDMCAFPLLFLSGKGSIALDAQEKANLREYLLRGGFLFVDDCVALGQPKQDLFFDSVNNVIREILPGTEMRRFTRDDAIYHSYYDMKGWTHMQGRNNGIWGAWYDGRLIMVTNSSDLHCAWVGFHFSKQQRLAAFQWAANVYAYAMSNAE